MSDPTTVSPSTTSSMAKTGRSNGGRRWLAPALGIGLVLVLLAIFLRPAAIPADYATLERGSFEVTLDEEGETRVRDRYTISAPLAGRVLRIELEPGDPVVAGETVLATFQPTDPGLLDARTRAEIDAAVRSAEAALGQARAELDRAKAELRYSENELARQRRLADDEIVSRERLEAAELDTETRREAVSAAEFAVRSAHFELERAQAQRLEGAGSDRGTAGSEGPITLTAPIDGVVLRRLRESESIVPAGEPLLEIADPARLEIVSDFLSTDAVKIEPGDRVKIEQWGGEGTISGQVRRVEPSGFTKISALGVEEQRVNVIVDFDDPQGAWNALGDGYRVEVRVVIHAADDALLVPSSALFRHGEGWAVYSVGGDSLAQLQEVELGRRNALVAEALEGLAEGATVLVHPGDAVVDGVRVTQRETR